MVISLRPTPALASWSSEPPLAQTRSYAQAVTLATGEVLIVGGMGRNSAGGVVMRTRAVIFDPLANASIEAGDLHVGRMWHTVTRLRDDRVLVAGGVERAGEGYDTLGIADIFDPRTRSWIAAAPMRHGRSDHAATLLRDGRVLVAGGHYGPLPIANVEIYDPATNGWTSVAPLPKTRWSFSMTTLRDGRVLAAGGFEQPGLQTDTSLLYDPARDTWEPGPTLLAERANHTTLTLRTGDLLLIGGQREGSNTAERYDNRLGRFVPAGTLADPRMFAQAAERPDGSVVLVGGILRPESGDGFVPNALAEVWDPKTNEWTRMADAPTARAGGNVAIVNGAVCLFGGSAEGDLPMSSVECFR
ncbi:MAG: kelch repeat-containing protein [Candidatus Limnocylindria bacterium]|nr:kelch repeat-containing protein [Candidatus Limnocylindria bacterium]